MTHTEKMTVMVVDDHPLMRVGIAAIINARSDMAVNAQAGTGEEAVTLYRRHKPEHHADGSATPRRHRRCRGHCGHPKSRPPGALHRGHHLRGR